MSNAIENAYLLLLAQMALITSSVLFSVPKLLYHEGGTLNVGINEWLFLIAVSLISVMMIINLIIGWASLRDILKKDLPYSIRMFMIDLIIVVILFFMNNVLMFSFKGEISLQSNRVIETTIKESITLETVSFMIAFISLLTGIFLFLCKKWNKHYYSLKNIQDANNYEIKLSVIIVSTIVFSIAGFIFNHIFWLQIVLLTLLLSSWFFINYMWVKDKFFN